MKRTKSRQSVARKHHHVPRAYLEKWGNTKGQVFFSRHGVVNPQATNPANLLSARDFYRMPLLNERATEFLGQYVEQVFVNPDVRTHAEKILQAYIRFSRTESFLGSSSLASECTKEKMRRAATSVAEQYLSQIESRADPIVEELRHDHITVLDSEVACDFFLFLGIQFFRTRRRLPRRCSAEPYRQCVRYWRPAGRQSSRPVGRLSAGEDGSLLPSLTLQSFLVVAQGCWVRHGTDLSRVDRGLERLDCGGRARMGDWRVPGLRRGHRVAAAVSATRGDALDCGVRGRRSSSDGVAKGCRWRAPPLRVRLAQVQQGPPIDRTWSRAVPRGP